MRLEEMGRFLEGRRRWCLEPIARNRLPLQQGVLKMTKVSLRPGLAYSFLYPRYNYAGLPRRLELRCVLVTDIRDTRIDRLNPQTKPLNPTLNRGV